MSAPSELWTATPGKRPWQTAYQRFRELERWLTDEHPSGRAFLVLLRGAVQGRHVFDRKLREYRAVRGGPTPGRLPEPPAELVSELRAIAGLRSCYDRDACGFVFEDVWQGIHPPWRWRRQIRSAPCSSSFPTASRGSTTGQECSSSPACLRSSTNTWLSMGHTVPAAHRLAVRRPRARHQ